jgi:hypothetical protein
MNPQAQTLNRIAGSGLGVGGTIAATVRVAKGRLTWSIATTILDCTVRGTADLGTRLPSATNRENGMRNLTEATNHSP